MGIGNTLTALKTNQEAFLSNECPSEVKERTFLKWTSIDLPSKLSLTYGGNVTYYKSVLYPILTLPVGTGNTFAIFKTNQ